MATAIWLCDLHFISLTLLLEYFSSVPGQAAFTLTQVRVRAHGISSYFTIFTKFQWRLN